MCSCVSTSTEKRAPIDELGRIDGKDGLIAGRIVRLTPTGRMPYSVAFRIARSLGDDAESTGGCEAYTDKMRFLMSELASGRQSFSPYASL